MEEPHDSEKRETSFQKKKKVKFGLDTTLKTLMKDLDPDLLQFYGGMAEDTSLDAVKKDHELFKTRIRRSLKGSKRLDLASSKDEFEKCLRKMGEDDSPELGQRAVEEFRIAAGTLLSYQQKRTHGMRRVNKALQESLFAVSRFVAAYSSILDAVSQAAGPYAQVGYQTMTILLIVSCIHQSKNSLFHCILT